MFEGFIEAHVDVSDTVRLRVRHGGDGPPVVLLHGHPRTHTTWYATAPALVSAGFTVVCPDLRGYGQSSKPQTTSDHEPYSKRAMAGDILALMQVLGHERFSVVGHDRGGYVALRLALDHPGAVDRLVFLGSVPIGEALARCGTDFATEWWHWFFLAQSDVPERTILADPDTWYSVATSVQAMGAENHADFARAVREPATVRAMLEDYRAGLGLDRAADDCDRAAGRTVMCPTLVLSARHDGLQRLYDDIPAIWAVWADDLTAKWFDSGHHMAEEKPSQLAEELISFLRGVPSLRDGPLP